MKSTKFTGLTVAAMAAVAMPVLFAPSAAADVDRVRVDNVSDTEVCAVGKPCYIRVRLTGDSRFDQVTVSVNGTVIGYSVPHAETWDDAATAEVTWVPGDYGKYTITAKQGYSSASIEHTLADPRRSTGSFGGLLPTGSAG
ncbi:hypothetical protein [Nocardia huaxiensis]|uniref:Bacterial Ig-like domain-containing protein n=1 Tax=Nocardia huaxiensis TaxID=2755382 RepID=A0A7D6Z2Q1_9NOCA|nr:hypothetical protein [Nocardia huaxiensis]QLY29444.1 hypothetical protein H0264_29920 [Nocardia huaxiensis]UFS97006.1 hypothetical protein LPY97_03470 [Nocardia huaxiensis]